MANPIEIAFKGNFLYYFLSLISRTCQFRISGTDRLERVLESGKPIIGTSWHGMTMMVIGSMRKYVDLNSIVTIIPDDFRGDILEIFANKIGIFPTKIDLSGESTLQMSRKLVTIIRKMQSGSNFLIHPDGPAGPAYKVKPGLTSIAQKTGAAIVPLGCYCRNAYHWHRWDRYTFPLPFSRIQVHVGEPLTIPTDLSNLNQMNLEIEKILNQVAFQAAADYYEIQD